jgi:hypothetical protein
MSHDIKFQIRLTEPALQHFDPSNQQSRIFDVVAAPVVRKNIEGVFASPDSQYSTSPHDNRREFSGVDEALVDLRLRQELKNLTLRMMSFATRLS